MEEIEIKKPSRHVINTQNYRKREKEKRFRELIKDCKTVDEIVAIVVNLKNNKI